MHAILETVSPQGFKPRKNMEIDVATAKAWLDSGKDDQGTPVFFLDCREPNEHQVASIAGTTLVPMSQWPPADCVARSEEHNV